MNRVFIQAQIDGTLVDFGEGRLAQEEPIVFAQADEPSTEEVAFAGLTCGTQAVTFPLTAEQGEKLNAVFSRVMRGAAVMLEALDRMTILMWGMNRYGALGPRLPRRTKKARAKPLVRRLGRMERHRLWRVRAKEQAARVVLRREMHRAAIGGVRQASCIVDDAHPEA